MVWRQVEVYGLAPAPRGGHAVAAVGDSILLFGGADRTPRAYDDLWQLRIGKDHQAEWTRISAAFPPSVACTARSGAALVTVGDKVYLFGGQEPNTGVCFNDVLELDTDTWIWTQLQIIGPRPPARHSCVAASFKDHCMVVYGGAGVQGALSDVWVFNCRDKSWSSPRAKGQPPAARETAAGVMADRDVLLIHGGRSADGKVRDDVIQLHMGDDWCWGSSSRTRLSRCAHTLVALPVTHQQQQPAQQQGVTTLVTTQQHTQQQHHQLLVFGGFSGNTVEGSLWALQQRHQQTVFGSIPITDCPWAAQSLHDGVDLQTLMAAKCGSNGGGGSKKQDCPDPRFAHAAACLPDPQHPSNLVVVVVGGVNPLEDLMDVYIWQ